MSEPMKLIEEEKEKLLKAKDEKAWYAVCEEIIRIVLVVIF